MGSERTEKITKELRSEVLTYWRDTVKDKDALCRTADLFGLCEEDIRRIIAVRWKEKKKFWDEDKVFRLRAYMAQGMKNAEIAKQLGCKPQAVADFKKRNKDIFSAYGEECNEECNEESIKSGVSSFDAQGVCSLALGEDGKKKESLTLGEVKDPEKKSDVEVDSSVDNYSISHEKCQEGSLESGDDEITAEMYNNLYTRFLEMWNKCEKVSGELLDVELVLKTAKYAGTEWCNRYDSYDNELGDCCRMYDMMIGRALGDIEKIRKILED